MTDLTKDIVVLISAVGGGIGLFITGFNFARSRNGYVKQADCKSELRDLHEKNNHLSDRVSKIEGKLEK